MIPYCLFQSTMEQLVPLQLEGSQSLMHHYFIYFLLVMKDLFWKPGWILVLVCDWTFTQTFYLRCRFFEFLLLLEPLQIRLIKPVFFKPLPKTGLSISFWDALYFIFHWFLYKF